MMNTGRLSSTHQPTNQCQRSGYLYKALFYNKNTDLSIYLHMQHLPSTNLRHLSTLQPHIQNLLAGQTGGPCRGAKQHIMPVVNIQLIQLLELAAGTFCITRGSILPTPGNLAGQELGSLIFDIGFLKPKEVEVRNFRITKNWKCKEFSKVTAK